MDNLWTRKRTADEVPTAIAVAVSDFCRRAGAPAPPGEVREALSTLSAEEDFRVGTLTDAPPAARPLGPYAVVDVLSGTTPALAAQREACGYYQLLKGFLTANRQAVAPPMPTGPGAGLRASSQPPASAPLGTQRFTAMAAPTVAQRIAPKRRMAAPKELTPSAPRGRFAQLPSEQPSLETLSSTQLGELLTQHGHRPALLRALARGQASHVDSHRLDRALEQAGLLERAFQTERELVLSTLEEQRGALGRTAWALGVRSTELLPWAERLGLKAAVERIRDRFRQEALQPVHWTARLDLLGRRKYLEDLGVSADFERSVTEDLRRALQALPDAADERTAVLATQLGVSPEALRRSLVRLGLSTDAASSPSPQSV